MQNPITKAHADYTDYIIRYGVDEAARILDSYRYSVDPQIPHMDADNAAWERAYMEAASAIIDAHQPTDTENAPQAATQAAEGTNEEKEAETMSTTEREALERINARQNAANLFTNITPADIAAELAAMEAEQAAPAPDPDAANLAPADAAQVWDEDGNTITTEKTTTDEQKEEEKPMSTTEREATATEAATVAGIIRRQGGYRERIILLAPHTMTHGETWNAAHKVVNVLESKPGPDGYRAGCAVDIVTHAIVG